MGLVCRVVEALPDDCLPLLHLADARGELRVVLRRLASVQYFLLLLAPAQVLIRILGACQLMIRGHRGGTAEQVRLMGKLLKASCSLRLLTHMLLIEFLLICPLIFIIIQPGLLAVATRSALPSPLIQHLLLSQHAEDSVALIIPMIVLPSSAERSQSSPLLLAGGRQLAPTRLPVLSIQMIISVYHFEDQN